ncbi:hypothetical protein ES703_22478 [subsurface metagenome]
MAKIKFSGLVSEIRGKLHNTIISGWKSGVFSVKGMMSAVHNPNSAFQDFRRDAVSQFSKAWFDTLLPTERALWETYALQQPGKYEISAGVRELVGSNGGIMSGQNAFVLTNCWLVSAGLVAVTDPPISVTPPSKPIAVTAVMLAGVLTVNWTAPGNAGVADVTRVWIASPSGTFHKQLVGFALTSAATLVITTVRGAKGKALDICKLIGEHYYIQADTVAAAGGKSGGSNTDETVQDACGV